MTVEANSLEVNCVGYRISETPARVYENPRIVISCFWGKVAPASCRCRLRKRQNRDILFWMMCGRSQQQLSYGTDRPVPVIPSRATLVRSHAENECFLFPRKLCAGVRVRTGPVPVAARTRKNRFATDGCRRFNRPYLLPAVSIQSV